MPAPRLAVAVGDSLTRKPYPGEYTNAGVGWMNAMPALFTTTGFEWRDQAVSGQNTATYLATYWTPALALRPRWMLIMLGTNDSTDLTIAQYTANLHRMFTEARAQNCEVVYITPPPYWYEAPPPTGYTGIMRRPYLIEPYRDAGIVQASADGVPFIDLYDIVADFYDTLGFATAWATYGVGGADRTHWIPAGASLAANFIAGQLSAVSPSLAGYLLTQFSEPAFATIAQVKADAAVTVTTYDAELQRIVDGVIARMKGWLGRDVSAKRYASERHSLATATPRLVLKNRPVISIVEVRIDGVAVSYLDYAIQLPEGVLYKAAGWPSGQHHIEVDYTAGYLAVPAGITSACIAQSRYVWMQHARGGDRFGEAQRAEGAGGSTAYIVQDWYPGVLDAMAPYRRLA